MVSATHGPSTSLAAAVAGNHVSGSKSRRNRGLFRRLSSGCQQRDYGAPVYASCAQNGRSPGHDLQTSLKKARMMLQVILGDESANPAKRLGAGCLRSRKTARGRRKCSRASGRPSGLSGIAGVLEGRRPLSCGSKVPPRQSAPAKNYISLTLLVCTQRVLHMRAGKHRRAHTSVP